MIRCYHFDINRGGLWSHKASAVIVFIKSHKDIAEKASHHNSTKILFKKPCDP
jgi:hypothetical protein